LLCLNLFLSLLGGWNCHAQVSTEEFSGRDQKSFQQSGVNFINILRAAFAPIFLHQKIRKPNCNFKKAAKNSFVQRGARKLLIKLTIGFDQGYALSWRNLKHYSKMKENKTPLNYKSNLRLWN